MKSHYTILLFLFSTYLFNSCSPKEIPRPAPKAAFSWASVGEGVIQLTDQSTEADSYSWSFGDGSPAASEKSPKHAFAKNAKYTVTLSVKNPTASDQISKDIEVSSFAAPVANFSVTSGEDGQITFTNTSTNAQSYFWDLGNSGSSVDISPVVKYTENKKYTITLTATGKGGEVKTSKEVEVVNVKPVVDFTWTNANGQVTFTNKTKNAESYSWDFDNGKTSTEVNPATRYLKAGTYTVKLTGKGKGGEVVKTVSVPITSVVLTLADVVEDQALINYLPGIWGTYVRGENQKFNNYTYEFSKLNNTLKYENYHNDYYTLLDPETTKLDYKFSITDKVIYTEGTGGKLEKYARFEILSDDEMKVFRILETSTSYRELSPNIFTRTSDVEQSMSSVVNSPSLLAILKGVWDQGNYSIYNDVAFDFSAGKNYYNYNSTFQSAKSIDKYEFKFDANNVMSYRRWNSDFDPSWKKYKVEVVSNSMLKLYAIDANGRVGSQAEYTLKKR
jgi:PKD repeat protein